MTDLTDAATRPFGGPAITSERNLSMTRDDILRQHTAARANVAEVAKRHAPILANARAATEAARQALHDAEAAERDARRRELQELHPLEAATARLERQLQLNSPAELSAAERALDSAIERLQEVPGPDATERAHLRTLLDLRGRFGELHLLPSPALRGRLELIDRTVQFVA